MIKLTIVQNAFHSLYHALEHLDLASHDIVDSEDRNFDHESHSVIHQKPDGSMAYYSGYHFTKPPASYNYKFAILHLIQAMELLIKGYLHSKDPDSIFEDHRRSRTISLRGGLRKLLQMTPDLLTPDQATLILQATDVRNTIEHFQFSYRVEYAQQIARDFLAICNYLALRLYSVSLVDEFSYDAWKDDYDPTGDRLGYILHSLGPVGSSAAVSMARLWQQNNTDDKMYLCMQCGARGASTKKGTCIVCGAYTDEAVGRMLDELDQLTMLHERLQALQKGRA